MQTVQAKDLPVSLSVGAITCISAPATVDEVVNAADRIMYQVKCSSKNDVKFEELRAAS